MSPTGKVYIGQSRNIVDRWRAYRRLECKSQRLLYRSLSKHGVNTHTFSIICELPDGVAQEYLDNHEIFVISQLREGKYKLLNIADGGHCQMNNDIRRRISVSKMGRKLTEQQLIDWNEKRAEFIMSEEARMKISQTHKGKKFTQEHKAKIASKTKERMNNLTEVFKCEHCGLETKIKGNLSRWHGSHCKYKVL